ARVVFADVELVEAELVCQMDERDVALERQRRVLARLVQRHHEKRELHRGRFLIVEPAMLSATAAAESRSLAGAHSLGCYEPHAIARIDDHDPSVGTREGWSRSVPALPDDDRIIRIRPIAELFGGVGKRAGEMAAQQRRSIEAPADDRIVIDYIDRAA